MIKEPFECNNIITNLKILQLVCQVKFKLELNRPKTMMWIHHKSFSKHQHCVHRQFIKLHQ